ncbi:MAG: helix-turn-helix transcriptional regulator [Microbacteriaceae bacterium]|nr:helix-turn-helix transcriptional regulator [Microbacteriaceae bacterium]
MTVRNALLAILTLGPAYGLQLASEFRRRTGGAEDVIDAQMYTTLKRLERDGVVAALPKDASGKLRYELTEQGRAEAEAWLAAPIPQGEPGARDQLALKVTLSATLPGADVRSLMNAQNALAREELARALAEAPDDLLADVVLARRRSSLQAELEWLTEARTKLGQVAPFGYAPPPKRGRRTKAEASPKPAPALEPVAG